jgi:hypothetical protein
MHDRAGRRECDRSIPDAVEIVKNIAVCYPTAQMEEAKKQRGVAIAFVSLWIVGTQIWYYSQFAELLRGLANRMLHSR